MQVISLGRAGGMLGREVVMASLPLPPPFRSACAMCLFHTIFYTMLPAVSPFHSLLTFSRLHEVDFTQVTESSLRIARNPPCLLSSVRSLCFRLRNAPFLLQATSLSSHSFTCLFKHTVGSIKLWTAQRLWTWNSAIKYAVPTCLPIRSFRSVDETF